VFRFETFGDEHVWTDTLHLNDVVEKNVDPTTALKVGLKVDADALPTGILEKVDLKSPATTVALLKMNAIVGLQATVNGDDHITRLGVTCALCHSNVDNSVMPGIGRRKDGWPNRDLNVGAVIALSPVLSADKKAVYASWGPGKYDPRYNQDGKNTPLVLPPAYGLAQVKNETYTGEGPISYWNAYVAVTQMGGQGNFADPRLGIDIKHSADMVTSKLPALRGVSEVAVTRVCWRAVRTPDAAARQSRNTTLRRGVDRESAVNEVFFDADVPRQHVRQETIRERRRVVEPANHFRDRRSVSPRWNGVQRACPERNSAKGQGGPN